MVLIIRWWKCWTETQWNRETNEKGDLLRKEPFETNWKCVSNSRRMWTDRFIRRHLCQLPFYTLFSTIPIYQTGLSRTKQHRLEFYRVLIYAEKTRKKHTKEKNKTRTLHALRMPQSNYRRINAFVKKPKEKERDSKWRKKRIRAQQQATRSSCYMLNAKE